MERAYAGEATRDESRIVRVTEWVISVAFALLFLGTPLFFTASTYQGLIFDRFFYFYVLILVAMVAWVTQGVSRGSMEIRRTPFDIPLVLFWIWYGVTAIFSVDRWHSFMGSFGDPSRGFVALTFFILGFYFIVTHATVARIRTAMRMMIIAGGIVTVWSALVLMNWVFLPKAIEAIMPVSFMGTITALALYLALLIPLFITGIFLNAEAPIAPARKRFTQGLMIALVVIDLFCLLTLYSFVSWVSVLVMATFFVIYIIAQLIRPAGNVSWLPMAAFVAILGFLMLGQVNLARITLPIEVSPTTSLSWQIAKSGIGHEWLTGTGPANFGYAFGLYKPVEFNNNELYTMRFGQANNIFLEILVTTGILGVILFAITLLVFLGTGLYLLTYNSKATNKVLSLGLWAGVVLFVVSSFLVTISGALLLVFIPVIALAYAALQKEANVAEQSTNFSLQASPKFALALAFTFMVVSAGVVYVMIFFGKVYAADMWALRAEKSFAKGELQDGLAKLTHSIALYPQESRYYLRLAQGYMGIANQEGQKGKDADQGMMVGAVQQSVRAGEVALRLAGKDVLVVESLALLYENALQYAGDALSRTEELYKMAGELDIQNPLYLVKLGELKRNAGDAKPEAERAPLYKEALTFFDGAVEKKKNLGVAYYHKALTYSRLNQLDQAIEQASIASQAEPGNVSYLYAVGALYELRNKEGDRDAAVNVYKNILNAYPSMLDVRLALALLYEKKNNRDAALGEYQQAIDLVAKSGDEAKGLKDQIQKLYDTVKNGGSNLATQAAPATPELDTEKTDQTKPEQANQDPVPSTDGLTPETVTPTP